MKIINALATNLVDSRQLEGWAGISPRTTYRRFVTESGLTFAQSRQQARLLRAPERIADVAPVTTIALDPGYDNASAFIDMVRRALGMTPGGIWRRVCTATDGCAASAGGNRQPLPVRQYVPSRLFTASPPFPLNCAANRSALLASSVVSTPTATNSAPASR